VESLLPRKLGHFSGGIHAAQLYDVAVRRAKPVYREPNELFALTYPTSKLRELAKDVLNRLAGRNGKALGGLPLP